MADPAEILLQHTRAVQSIAARVPGGVEGLSCARDSDVVALVAAAQAVVRSAQGLLAAASGELARRSQGDGDASLARRLGEKSAVQVVAKQAGVSLSEAARFVTVGEATVPRVALSGEDLVPKRPHVAAAVAAGTLSVALAESIDRTLATVAGRLWADQADALERMLVEKAVSNTWSVADFTAYCRRIPNTLDPDGAELRENELRGKASIRATQLDNGMLRIVMELDPERAGFWLAAMRARTNPRRTGLAAVDANPGDQSTGDENVDVQSVDVQNMDVQSPGDESAAAESPNVTPFARHVDPSQPTPMQAKLDALTAILRDSLRADEGRNAGVDTTMLVRIDLTDLQSGLGTATIDGVQEPISATTARRLAVEADLIPQVFDGKSVLLNQGESKRAFTRQQRYAILALYAGCVFPKCDVPGSMAEIHHIGQWATRSQHRKGTDLLNGVPLCGFHNRLMEQGWELSFDDDRIPWFTPPPHVDPTRTPVRGGHLAHSRAA